MRKALAATAAIAVLGIAGAVQAADTLRVLIMAAQDPKKEGPKYAALAEYLRAGPPQIGEAGNEAETVTLVTSGTGVGVDVGVGVRVSVGVAVAYLAWRYGVRPQDNDTSVTGWMVIALKSPVLANIEMKGKAVATARLRGYYDASLNSDGHHLGFLAAPDWYGQAGFRVWATDAGGLSAEAAINVKVLSVNDAPRLKAAGPLAASQGVMFDKTFSATDADLGIDPGEVLAFSRNSTCLELEPETGRAWFTPDNSQVGTHLFNLTVTDSYGASDTKIFTLRVAVEDDELATRPFRIEGAAKEAILDFLSRRAAGSMNRAENNVEPFQLQLICQHLEAAAQRKQGRGPAPEQVTVTLSDIGGPAGLRLILQQFYRRQLGAVPGFLQRSHVRKLCSEGLITPNGRRVRMEQSEIGRIYRIKPATLQILVENRLLRAEQDPETTYYELSHDSLIGPVLRSRRFFFILRAVWAVLITLLLVFLGAWILTPALETESLFELAGAALVLSVPALVPAWGPQIIQVGGGIDTAVDERIAARYAERGASEACVLIARRSSTAPT